MNAEYDIVRKTMGMRLVGVDEDVFRETYPGVDPAGRLFKLRTECPGRIMDIVRVYPSARWFEVQRQVLADCERRNNDGRMLMGLPFFVNNPSEGR